MSNAALTWAYGAKINRSTDKFVLVTLANYADDTGVCYPSQARLVADTSIDRKTVAGAMTRLQQLGFIADTGERRGNTGQIIVYRIIGMHAPTIHYTYRVTCPKTGEFYIGKRSFDGDPHTDNYKGSGAWVKFAQAEGRILIKEVFEKFDTASEAIAHENCLFREFQDDPLCRNLGTPKMNAAIQRGTAKVIHKHTKNGRVIESATTPNFHINSPKFPHKEAQISPITTPNLGDGTLMNHQGTTIEPPVLEQPTHRATGSDLFGEQRTATPASKPKPNPGERGSGRKAQIPEDWKPDAAGMKFAADRSIDAKIEISRFVDNHRSKGNTFADIAAAWRTWCASPYPKAMLNGHRIVNGHNGHHAKPNLRQAAVDAILGVRTTGPPAGHPAFVDLEPGEYHDA